MVFFIWSGLGFLVPLITLASLVLTQILPNSFYADPGYYKAHLWPKLVAIGLAAASIWPLGTSLNSPSARILVGRDTGERVVFGPKHSFFFIPLQYWAVILILIGVFAAFDDRR